MFHHSVRVYVVRTEDVGKNTGKHPHVRNSWKRETGKPAEVEPPRRRKEWGECDVMGTKEERRKQEHR